MEEWSEEIPEFEDYPERIEEEIDENVSEMDLEIPDVWWREDIEKIEDPEIREREIEVAERIIEKKEALNERLDSGEITQGRYDDDYLLGGLREEGRKAATRSGLGSVGVTYDVLGDLLEDQDFLIHDLASGNTELMDAKGEVKEIVGELGTESARELADRMKDEGEIGEDAHETISRQVRLHGK